jgi:hypothetical protein
MVIVGFIVINQFVVWFLRVDYLYKGLRSTKKLLSGQILALISVQSQLLMLTRNCAAHIHTKF